MEQIEPVELGGGWRVVGDPTSSGKDGLRILDGQGDLVRGVQRVVIDKAVNKPLKVAIELHVRRPA